jgi:hypothetical protein
MDLRHRMLLLLSDTPPLVFLTAFNQSLGSELVSNGGFATNLTGWSTSGSPETVEAVGGRAHVVESGPTGFSGINQTVAVVIGTLYLFSFDYEVVSGTMRIDYGVSGVSGLQRTTGSGTLNVFFVGNAASASMLFRSNNVAAEFYVDNVSVKAVTLSAIQTTLADAQNEVLFTQQASPELDDQVSLVYRYSDATNYWLVSLRFNQNSSQWDIYHRKVVAGVQTTLQTFTNVGTGITGLRVNANGSDHDIFAQISGVWTSLGTTQTDSNLASATGLSVLYTPGMEPIQLTSKKI